MNNWLSYVLYGVGVIAAGIKQTTPNLSPLADSILQILQVLSPTGLLFTKSIVAGK